MPKTKDKFFTKLDDIDKSATVIRKDSKASKMFEKEKQGIRKSRAGRSKNSLDRDYPATANKIKKDTDAGLGMRRVVRKLKAKKGY